MRHEILLQVWNLEEKYLRFVITTEKKKHPFPFP